MPHHIIQYCQWGSVIPGVPTLLHRTQYSTELLYISCSLQIFHLAVLPPSILSWQRGERSTHANKLGENFFTFSLEVKSFIKLIYQLKNWFGDFILSHDGKIQRLYSAPRLFIHARKLGPQCRIRFFQRNRRVLGWQQSRLETVALALLVDLPHWGPHCGPESSPSNATPWNIVIQCRNLLISYCDWVFLVWIYY